MKTRERKLLEAAAKTAGPKLIVPNAHLLDHKVWGRIGKGSRLIYLGLLRLRNQFVSWPGEGATLDEALAHQAAGTFFSNVEQVARMGWSGERHARRFLHVFRVLGIIERLHRGAGALASEYRVPNLGRELLDSALARWDRLTPEQRRGILQADPPEERKAVMVAGMTKPVTPVTTGQGGRNERPPVPVQSGQGGHSSNPYEPTLKTNPVSHVTTPAPPLPAGSGADGASAAAVKGDDPALTQDGGTCADCGNPLTDEQVVEIREHRDWGEEGGAFPHWLRWSHRAAQPFKCPP